MVQINSNEELYQALQKATAGRISRVGDTGNPMTLKLKEDYCVTVYADNHEILVGIFRGNERLHKRYHSYDQVYRAILGMETGTMLIRKNRKITPERNDGKKKNTIKRVMLFILDMALSLFGGILLLFCIFGALRDGFSPLHVHLSLLFSFGMVLLAGIAVIYIGLRKHVESEAAAYNSCPVKIPDRKTVKLLLQELRNRTEKDAIKIRIDESRKPTLMGSKLGGIPYWDNREAYPAASDGTKLVLLAQFNLGELPENDLLPKVGLLQFFILDDMSYGLPIQESGYTKNTYRVVYHDKIDESITEAQVLALGARTSELPVMGERAVCFQTEKAYMNDNDVRCNDMLHKIAEEMGIELDDRLEFYHLFDVFADGDRRYADVHEATYGHFLFGYPQFRQFDPRNLSVAEYYDTMLFQLDSDSWFGEWRVLWGDAGVGAFFINSKRLADMDFDDVLYNWDCC